MDLRQENDLVSGLGAIDDLVSRMSLCVEKALDTLDRIPPVVEYLATVDDVSNEELHNLEQAVLTGVEAVRELSGKVFMIEDLFFYLRKLVQTSTNKQRAGYKLDSIVGAVASENEDSTVEDNDGGCSRKLLGDFIKQEIAQSISGEDGIVMDAEPAQRGRRRSRSATRLIKKVIRRLSFSRTRTPNSNELQFEPDTTIPTDC